MLSLHSLPPFSSPIQRFPRFQTSAITKPPHNLTLNVAKTLSLTYSLSKRPTLLLSKALPAPSPAPAPDSKEPTLEPTEPEPSAPTDPNPDDSDETNDGENNEENENEDGTGDSDEQDDKPHPSHLNSDEPSKERKATLQLAVVFGFWYFQNVVFNIYNKKTLNLFPYPWLLASFQLLVGSLWMGFLWLTGLQPFPKISKQFFIALLGPALFHTIGHISACVSFSKVAVSFTHVIKASEPVFSVIISAFHGQYYPIHVWLSVLPIVFGCSLAVITEISFNAQGLWGALISNVGFVLRNIYSKKSLHKFKHINGLNLYGWISIVSLIYLFPVAVFVEGKHWVDGFERALALSSTPWTFYGWVLLSGVFYHLYNQSSYQALDKISPLTFSVGNTMKRVVVIVASLLVFRNPIRPLNALGSAIAVLGTFLYSQATMMQKNKEKEKRI